MAEQPERMFAELAASGASADLYPPMPFTAGRLNAAAHADLPLAARVAVWLADCGPDQVGVLAERLRLPTDCRDLALLLVHHRTALLQPGTLSAEDRLNTLERCDGLRRADRFKQLLAVLPFLGASSGTVSQWLQVQAAAASVDAGSIALAVRTQEHIAARIRDARIDAIQNLD
jgi:tRNA nucleotidyltransferase (CCA-adding enzyme)